MSTAATVETMEVRPPAFEVNFALPNMRILQDVLGPYDRNINYIERKLDVRINNNGSDIQILGKLAEDAQHVMRDLYRILECEQEEITEALIDSKIKEACGERLEEVVEKNNVVHHAAIRTRKKTIVARNPAQARYIMDMKNHEMIFGLGPAGTGKTYLAVAQAVSQLIDGSVQRLIFSRPAVEAGEKLGFLPGDMKEKVDPYLRPIYDALYDCMPPEQVERRLASGEIEIAPIAFMRGRTLADAFVILDEAQNTTREQMKMFLTRFGQNSRMVICGDPNQTDIPGGPSMSGLTDAINRLRSVDEIAFSQFTSKDVVRHSIVGKIVDAYEGENAS